MIVITLAFTTQGFAVNGILPAVITTLEKRFALTSTASGFLSTVYNIAFVITLFPMCHYANKGKPLR